MRNAVRGVLAGLLLTALVGGGSAVPALLNPILFVTQIPIPEERNDNSVSNTFVSVVSPLGNHLGDTIHAARGGDLWLRYTNGALKNLTRAAGFGTNGSQNGVGIAVRDPRVHWSGGRAIFSMVAGSPTNATDPTPFFWQLYELTNLTALVANSNTPPAIVKVPNQPANFNNVMACYGTDGRIIFACDRARNGAAHLYPQLDEYNDIPSNSGLWSLNPADGDLFLMDHSPSGSFDPFIDSFGRVIFTRWDHLVQDRSATDDRLGRATNGTFNYFSEDSLAWTPGAPVEFFPEPRTYDSNVLAVLKVQGNAINIFFPWMINEDGTSMEVLNHIGRHELAQSFRGSSFTNDPNLVQQFTLTPGGRFNTNSLNNIFTMREDPLHPGSYFGVDGPDFGMHSAGQILKLFGPPGTNADRMFITYVTPKVMVGPNTFGAYRNPLPLSDGSLVACFTTASSLDNNLGTAAAPRSRYNFRLTTLTNGGLYFTNSQLLTSGLTNSVTYWAGPIQITYNNALWELSPVEVVTNKVPARQFPAIADVEEQVIAEEGIDASALQTWLRSNDLALVISRNVTTRDSADREQPFNLRIPGTTTQTLGTNTGKIYDIRYLQFLQADQLRGLTYATPNPIPGRRVLATPLHSTLAYNLTNHAGPTGSVRLGDDGSQAAFLPARRAMTHQLTDLSGNAIVRERYWLTYQPGEIRTCTSCHGVNTKDQAGQTAPKNKPQALRDLLRYWKQQTGYAKILSATPTNSLVRLNISAPPLRTNILQATTDFLDWQPIGTNSTSTNGLFWLDDLDAASFSNRFYRLLIP